MFHSVYKTILKAFCELFTQSVSREMPSRHEADKKTGVVSAESTDINAVHVAQIQRKIIKIAYMKHIDIQVVCSISEGPVGMLKTIHYLRKNNEY